MCMERIYVFLIFVVFQIALPLFSVGQGIVDPPTDGDEFGWMRWVIITLFGGLVTAFGIIKKIYDDRLGDKTKEIEELKKTIEGLNTDKDDLQRDIMEKVIPAFVSATDLIRSVMNK